MVGCLVSGSSLWYVDSVYYFEEIGSIKGDRGDDDPMDPGRDIVVDHLF